MLKPGYETTEHLWSPNSKILKKYVDHHIIPFLEIEQGDTVFDIGEYNPRVKYISERMNLTVKTIDSEDFNWDKIKERQCKTIFAFEIVEHLQNPLFFMNELKKAIAKDGSIYVIIPCNPRWMWHCMHFFEMDRKHFEKWILNPLKLKIVRYKKIIFIASWKTYLIGFRPLMRLLFGKTTIKNFIRNLLYVQYAIYEIRK